MRLNMSLFFFSICCLNVLIERASADFHLRVGNGSTAIQASASNIVSIPIWGNFTTVGEADTYLLSTVAIAVDFEPLGAGAGAESSVFPLANIDVIAAPPNLGGVVFGGGVSFLSSTPSSPGTANWDKRFSVTFNNSVPLPNSLALQRLFDLSFTVPVNATAGTYGINIVLAPTVPSNGTNIGMSDGSFYQTAGNGFLDAVGPIAVTNGFLCRSRIQLGEMWFPSMKLVACEAIVVGGRDQMIIGRDILNQCCVKFNGKRQQFSFEEA